MISIGKLFDRRRPEEMSPRQYAMKILGIDPTRYYRWLKQPIVLPDYLELVSLGKKVSISEDQIREVYEHTKRKSKT